MTTKVFVRGGTLHWSTTFFDEKGVEVQPDSATINIVYATPTNAQANATVVMTPGSPGVPWTAIWDTRGASVPQTVWWSIHTGNLDPAPVAVEDGSFALTGNLANLVTF